MSRRMIAFAVLVALTAAGGTRPPLTAADDPAPKRAFDRKDPKFDELITKVWKEPAFFLAHPRAIAAFGRECTCRGVPPPTVNLFGSPFLTWRGLPIIPCDKLHVTNDGGRATTDILLLRTGERKRGVVGLFQPGLPGEVSPSLSVRWMGINSRGAASYLASDLTYDYVRLNAEYTT